MRVLLCFFLCVEMIDPALLQGRWKLVRFDSFLNILNSTTFKMGTPEHQTALAEDFQFALDNTFYEFRGDSVFFTDARRGTVVEKRGKWILDGDTIKILDADKVKQYNFWVVNLKDDQLEMSIFNPGEVVLEKRSSLFFSKDLGKID